MSSSMKVDVSQLKELASRIVSHQLKSEMEEIAKTKPVAALIAQAIRWNFAVQGPGWQALTKETIRRTVSKARRKMPETRRQPHRVILQRTGLLKKSVTSPGAKGNIYFTIGTTVVWGTNLSYAAIHNTGGVIMNPGTSKGFGRGIKIPPHAIKIPKREYLVISDGFKNIMTAYFLKKIKKIVKKAIQGGA